MNTHKMKRIYLKIFILILIPFWNFGQCMEAGAANATITYSSRSGNNCTYNVTFKDTTEQNSVKWIRFKLDSSPSTNSDACYYWNSTTSSWTFDAACNTSGSNAGSLVPFEATRSFIIPCDKEPIFSYSAGRGNSGAYSGPCKEVPPETDIRLTYNYGTLPLKVQFFNSKAQNEGLILSWQTTEERGVNEIVLEKSLDAQIFYPVAEFSLLPDGRYEYLDSSPIRPVGYYRLKILDKDGTSSYSRIISTFFTGEPEFYAYPNPINGENYFTLNGIFSYKSLHAFNPQGQTLALDSKLSIYGLELKVLSTYTGVFIVEVVDEFGEAKRIKLLKN